MNYHSHKIAGFCLGVTGGILLTQSKTDPLSLGVVALSAVNATAISVLPDIDHRNSYIGKKHKITSYIANRTMGHRGAMHSPFMLFLLTSILLLGIHYVPIDYLNWEIPDIISIKKILYVILFSFVLGYMSHLLMDSLTVSGIPWFYPFSKNCYSLGHLKTNQHEIIAQIIFLVPTIIYICYTYQLFDKF